LWRKIITANKPKDQVVIYTIHESDRGQKVRWLLEEMAVPYEVVLMNRRATPEQYAEINPMMCVPTLEFDGKTMFGSTAILAFLADRFVEKGLAPPVESSDRHLYICSG
jgi:glutathione S-transferase